MAHLFVTILVLGTGLGIGLGLSEAPAGPQRPPLTAQLELSATQVVAGHSIKGLLVIENDTTSSGRGRPPMCFGYVVVLTNRHFHQQFAVPVGGGGVACPDPASILKRGVTRFHFMIFTTVGACTRNFSRPPPKDIPYCLSDGDPPPIPPGRYFTTVEWLGSVRPAQPETVEVTVLPPR
jgi:hypothetical protein